MNTTELIARCRMSAFIDTANTDFTDSWILRELYDQLTQLYERAVVNSKSGYWLKTQNQLITQGVDKYRIPRRCVSGGLHRLQIAYDNTLNWQDLDEVDEVQAQNYALQTRQTGQVQRWVMRGDTITLLPVPNGANYALRIFYYVKPSRLVPPQGVSGAGSVITIDPVTRIVTLGNPIVYFDLEGVQTAVTFGFFNLDAIEVGGQNPSSETVQDDGGNWHELSLVNEIALVSDVGFTLTFQNTLIDLSYLKLGDRIRVQGQTEWACIPDDFHRSLADAAAVKILRMRSMFQKALDLESTLGQDLARFGDLLTPRVQASAKAIVRPNLYRGKYRGNWQVKFP